MKRNKASKLKYSFVTFFLVIGFAVGYISPTNIYAEQRVTMDVHKENFPIDTSSIKTITFIGDDCGVGLEVAAGNDKTKTWYCERGKGLTWLKSQFDDNKNSISKMGNAVVVAIGFNECSNTLKAKEYAEYLNNKVDEINNHSNVPFYYVGVTPVDETKYGTALNSKIVAWNKYMQDNLDERIVYIDAYSLVNENLETKNDGYHLIEDEYRMIYENVVHTMGLKTAEEIAQQALNEANAKKEVKAINGWGFDKQGEAVYYDENQNVVTGWYEIEGGKYYFDQYGHCIKGLHEIDGKTYYFNSIGLMSRGLVKIEEGKYSLFGDDGARLDKWQEYAGDKYYINKDGLCLTGWWTIGTRTYYFEEDGAVAKGLTHIDGKIYYFDDDGGVRVGWQTIDGHKYYFEDGGQMAVGKYELDGCTYYFDKNEGMIIGWNTENDGVRYYTSDGIMATGFQIIEGDGYFFAEGGLMGTGWYEFSEGKRYFDATGKMKKGLSTVLKDVYYFDSETGYMQSGWVDIDGEKTYFGENGKLISGWQKIDGKEYYLDNNGHITTDIAQTNGKIYLFNKSGAIIFAFPIWAVVVIIFVLLASGVGICLKKKPEVKEKMIKGLKREKKQDVTKFKTTGEKHESASEKYDDNDEEIIEDD